MHDISFGFAVVLVPCALDAALDARKSSLDLHTRAKLLTWHCDHANRFYYFGQRQRNMLREYMATNHRHRRTVFCWTLCTTARETMQLPYWTIDATVYPSAHERSSDSPDPKIQVGPGRLKGTFWFAKHAKGINFAYAAVNVGHDDDDNGKGDSDSDGNDGSSGSNDGGSDSGTDNRDEDAWKVSIVMVGEIRSAGPMAADKLFMALDKVTTDLGMTVEDVVEHAVNGRMRVVYANVETYGAAKHVHGRYASCGQAQAEERSRVLTSKAEGSERSRRQTLLDVVEHVIISPPETFPQMDTF